MSDKLPELQNGQQGPNAQDPSRRRLLRAAASAAPLIATLPSGAALAASAVQCIVQDDTANDFVTSTDGWLRTQATKALWQTGSLAPVPAYQFSSSGPWYFESDGTEVNRANTPTYVEVTPTTRQTVYVLQMYTPLPTDNPMNVGPCQITASPAPTSLPTPTTTPPDPVAGCVFPVAQRTTMNDNVGLSNSCLTSIRAVV